MRSFMEMISLSLLVSFSKVSMTSLIYWAFLSPSLIRTFSNFYSSVFIVLSIDSFSLNFSLSKLSNSAWYLRSIWLMLSFIVSLYFMR